MTKSTYLQVFAWSLSGVVTLLAVVAWGQGINWQFDSLSVYSLFPLLGLVAFSVMWTHYIVSATRQYLGIDKQILHIYIELTGWLVLALIVLHPGLLEWQLLRDGFGLPPGSVLQHYVTPSLRAFAVLGMVSLILMLAYELRRWYDKKPWWPYIGYAVDLGMLLLFIHSIKLGQNLQSGWPRSLWLFYGVTLVIAMSYLYSRKFSKSKQ